MVVEAQEVVALEAGGKVAAAAVVATVEAAALEVLVMEAAEKEEVMVQEKVSAVLLLVVLVVMLVRGSTVAAFEGVGAGEATGVVGAEVGVVMEVAALGVAALVEVAKAWAIKVASVVVAAAAAEQAKGRMGECLASEVAMLVGLMMAAQAAVGLVVAGLEVEAKEAVVRAPVALGDYLDTAVGVRMAVMAVEVVAGGA